jgi:hypothetical protein
VQADNIHYVSIKEGEVAGRLLTVLKGVRVRTRESITIGPYTDQQVVSLLSLSLSLSLFSGTGQCVGERER